MGETATNPSTFPLFSSLAPELRDQIWREALPDDVGPALNFYKKGCWHHRRLLESDEEYHPQSNLVLEFRHDLFNNIEFEVPLIFVNREARDIGLTWLREQGIKIRFCEDRQYPIFVRPFDPICDALYVPFDEWRDFQVEPLEQTFEPPFSGEIFSTRTNITRLAVPEALLLQGDFFSQMFLDHDFTKVMLIVADPQPDMDTVDNVLKVQRRWEFESKQGGAFFWDEVRRIFEFKGSKHVGHEALYKLIEGVTKGLGEELVTENIHSFEIRPVFAVKK